MSSAAASVFDTEMAPRKPLRGSKILEFLLVGGATLVLLPLAWLYRESAGLDSSEYIVSFTAFYAAYAINDPHFAVSYLLFYKDVKNRALGRVWDRVQTARYLVSGFIVPVALVAWGAYAIGSGSAQLLGGMVQLMFLLVGWHYVKQGFGVLSVLSARKGVHYSPRERRVVLAHCFIGWAYAWATPADPGSAYEENGLVYTSIAHPPGLDAVTGVAFFASGLALLWVLFQKWRREGRLPPLSPIGGLLISVWMWMVYSDLDPLLAYVIPALHSIQYLYFVWLMKRNEARATCEAGDFKSVRLRLAVLALTSLGLAWLIFHGIPETLDTTFVLRDELAPLGPTPFLAAFVTAINIHHYFMDHVIWRRENPDTRYLRG